MYGVRFVPLHGREAAGCDGVVLFDATRAEALRWARSGVRCLAYIHGPMEPIGKTGRDISFADSPCVVPAFRGATLEDAAVDARTDLGDHEPREVMARHHGNALWIRHAEERSSADLVGVAAPAEVPDYLFARFHQGDWFSVLPLLTFVRETSGWMPGPVRACFMFDDPNLHWKSYGYVNYAEVVRHATAHDYHASFAMVPMDAWYAHSRTARLFTESPDRLSLLIHGNDHTHFELHRSSPHDRRLAVASQALRRMERFERESGVRVAKVMAAPHGACSEAMASALAQTGFEAATISRGSLMSRNPGTPWPIAVGLHPAESFGGLPILPRFSIHSDPQSRVRFAAFLGQPVIPVGHHDDLQDGLDVMARTARVVNSIDGSVWMDTTRIARTNYLSRRDQDGLHIRTYSRKIDVEVPPQVTRLSVERPSLVEGESERLILHGSATRVVDRYEGQPLDVEPGSTLTITTPPSKMLDPYDAPRARTALQAIVRRQLCEGRDRVRPAVDRVRGWVSR